MEVVFVLDTTGSMSGMIAGAKQKIWAIANKLKSAQPTPEIRFGLVGYRDRGDVYVTKVFGLTGNLDEVYTNLYAFEAEGGGDEPESVNEALHKAVRDLQWSTDPEVLRVIFLVGDARPHMDYPDDVKYPETCRLANRKGILINTLQCGRLSGTEEVWREIAALTNGTYSAILQDGGTIKIETPYDQEIIRLNLQLNATIIRYGSKDEQENAAKNKSVLAALSSEAMADRSSYLGKGEAGAVLSGRGDLVVEVMNGRESLDKLDEEKLAPELQAMAPGARQELIAKKVEERRTLQAELAELVAKRDAEVAKQMKNLEGKGGAMELDAFRALETQAREKGYRFEEKR
ncbi:von Willebrand factor type A domain-containing protein [Opitutus sp. GAS368]|nr:von Willebrand factor type A domain-containing protein [Opitutus sp. GAS368]